jgi:hypothetical protein
MMEAARTSETSVDIQLRTRQYVPEDSDLLKSKFIQNHMKFNWNIDLAYNEVSCPVLLYNEDVYNSQRCVLYACLWRTGAIRPQLPVLQPAVLCSCLPHTLTVQKSILGVQAPGILFSSTERDRKRSYSDVESSGVWPLSLNSPPSITHVSPLRHPDHKVRITEQYKGGVDVGVELRTCTQCRIYLQSE